MIAQSTPYRDFGHGSFDEEWGCHDGSSEWWYATGYVRDAESNLYGYQYTLNRINLQGVYTYLLITSITDFAGDRHLYTQRVASSDAGITIDGSTIRFDDVATLTRDESGIRISAQGDGFSFGVALDYGKGAFWHCENGVLRMGSADTEATTTYYSYTNMPTVGALVIDGRSVPVSGKTWFDRQGGHFDVLDGSTHWEWFSLRFDDDEEVMLFSFPQNSYGDGTYIPADGSSRRFNDYTITPLTFQTVEGNKYSTSWTLHLPGVKGEDFTLKPINQAQLSGAFLEILCTIEDVQGHNVGLCYVELLPGVYNDVTSLIG